MKKPTGIIKMSECLVFALLMISSFTLEAGEKKFTFEFKESDLKIEDFKEYKRVQLKDSVSSSEIIGAPELPVKFVDILLPAGAMVSEIKYSAKEKLITENIDLFPTQRSYPLSRPQDMKWTKKKDEIYSSSKCFLKTMLF